MLSLPKNGQLAARSTCVYHIGNKPQWSVSLPRELATFQSQALSLPGSETQVLPEYIRILRGRLKPTKPPKLNARWPHLL